MGTCRHVEVPMKAWGTDPYGAEVEGICEPPNGMCWEVNLGSLLIAKLSLQPQNTSLLIIKARGIALKRKL